MCDFISKKRNLKSSINSNEGIEHIDELLNHWDAMRMGFVLQGLKSLKSALPTNSKVKTYKRFHPQQRYMFYNFENLD